MISAWRTVARPSAALAAVLAVVFGLTLSGPAFAGQGGNGQGGSSTATDHQTAGTAGTSGTATEPQPQSNADQNAGGANGKCAGGPYCSTRDGSASANGQGGGTSTGKPCAGCVGKADNKNPKGQYPGPGSDGNMDNHNTNGNAGYECDRNQGIAKGNPAHTGCTTTSPPPPTTDECTPGPGEHVDANGDCVKNSDDKCVPGKGEYVDANGNCVTIAGEDECVPGEGEKKFGDECVPVCPTDSTIPMDDEDCNPAGGGGGEGPETGGPETGGPETGTPEVGRPPVVAGVEAFAGPQPPAGVERLAGPSTAAGTPAGVLPMTGASTLMNALAAAGLGLLVLGAALLRHRASQS